VLHWPITSNSSLRDGLFDAIGCVWAAGRVVDVGEFDTNDYPTSARSVRRC